VTAPPSRLLISSLEENRKYAIVDLEDVAAVEPKWSPDGNLITFINDLSLIGEPSTLWVVSSTGEDLRQLELPGYITIGEATLDSISWAPDSARLVLAGMEGMYIISLDGTPPIYLGDGHCPDWQPGDYSIGSISIPTQTPTYGSLDLSNPESIVYWLAHDMVNGTIDSFRRVIMKDTLQYGTGFAGGRDSISRQTFMLEIGERITNKPLCVGYTFSSGHITLWTKNWQPVWDFRGEHISEEITFSFFLYDGDVDTWAYFYPSSDILEVVDHQPCPLFDEVDNDDNPRQDGSRQYAKISSQVVEVNLRATPGYLGKNDLTDVLVKIPSGELVEIIGGSEDKDSLTWWKITWNGYIGWIADHTASGRVIMDFDL
jgi:hypothetical protein